MGTLNVVGDLRTNSLKAEVAAVVVAREALSPLRRGGGRRGDFLYDNPVAFAHAARQERGVDRDAPLSREQHGAAGIDLIDEPLHWRAILNVGRRVVSTRSDSPSLATRTSPSRSVRYTRAPIAARRVSVDAAGWRY